PAPAVPELLPQSLVPRPTARSVPRAQPRPAAAAPPVAHSHCAGIPPHVLRPLSARWFEFSQWDPRQERNEIEVVRQAWLSLPPVAIAAAHVAARHSLSPALISFSSFTTRSSSSTIRIFPAPLNTSSRLLKYQICKSRGRWNRFQISGPISR